MAFLLTKETTFFFAETPSTAVKHIIEIFKRDYKKVFLSELRQDIHASVTVMFDDSIENAEQFRVDVTNEKITIACKDELAMLYAVLYMSRQFLGVDDFWFWAEKEPSVKTMAEISEGTYLSPRAKVRYRGWFVNDEVCLIGWSDVYPPSRKIWECVFETLLRLGGNMVIPGTDLPRDGEHFEIATEMGLYITHHHAEPLGGEMFLRAYPREEASYDTNPELFQKLWSDAIDKNKDKKIIWTLGFRGQGDAPFWHNDPKYVTPESRAGVIRSVIDRQYEMICEKVENPVCAVYLYGEITELYEQGYLKLPEKFIKIWSDNGYGKMVTRRNGNHNPRIPSLPKGEPGMHGLYYHVTFHDLQASNHLTMLPNPPEMVNDELDEAILAGADDYWLINCGNIRPHLYFLDLIAKKWNSGSVDMQQFKQVFFHRFFRGAEQEVMDCYNEYFKCTVKYGINQDDRAGDEFYYHSMRRIIVSWAKKNVADPNGSLFWATGEKPFAEQIKWFQEKCSAAVLDFGTLYKKCTEAASKLDCTVFFRDNMLFQVRLNLAGAKSFVKLCEAFEAYKKEEYAKCFVLLTDAINELNEAIAAMEESEHGKWKNFYSADWLTNVRVTKEQITALRKYIRLLGDAPDYFKWFKGYIMPETERQIYLENTQRRTLDDDDLAEKLKEALNL